MNRIEDEIRWGDAKRYAEEWLTEVSSYEKRVVAAALLNLLAERAAPLKGDQRAE